MCLFGGSPPNVIHRGDCRERTGDSLALPHVAPVSLGCLLGGHCQLRLCLNEFLCSEEKGGREGPGAWSPTHQTLCFGALMMSVS